MLQRKTRKHTECGENMDVHENGETSNGQTETTTAEMDNSDNPAKRQVTYYHCMSIIYYQDSV
jgi:hypothetical protein